jgi:hypothetical protein
MNTVNIKVIPHAEQRYETCGDYYFEPDAPGILNIRVSELGDWRMNMLVAIHELVEVSQCVQSGVKIEDIDAFDKLFERERIEGKHTPQDEPGDDRSAPYYVQHQIATGVERILAGVMGVDWNKYANAVEAQSNGKV